MLFLLCDGYRSEKSDVVRVLEEAAIFQVVLDDDVCNGVEHKLEGGLSTLKCSVSLTWMLLVSVAQVKCV